MSTWLQSGPNNASMLWTYACVVYCEYTFGIKSDAFHISVPATTPGTPDPSSLNHLSSLSMFACVITAGHVRIDSVAPKFSHRLHGRWTAPSSRIKKRGKINAKRYGIKMKSSSTTMSTPFLSESLRRVPLLFVRVKWGFCSDIVETEGQGIMYSKKNSTKKKEKHSCISWATYKKIKKNTQEVEAGCIALLLNTTESDHSVGCIRSIGLFVFCHC